MTDSARKALDELRDYFEQKRNLHIRQAHDANACIHSEKLQADCYDHALTMVAAYIAELKPERT